MNETEKNEILNLSKDLGEVGIDSLLEDGIFKDVPFLGAGISIVRLINSVSDRILLAKIIHFINELELKNQKEVDKFKKEYFKDKQYHKIGSKILLILERADSLTKIKWLAKGFRLLVDRKVSKEDFLRISSIINAAFVEDVTHITVFDKRLEITSTNDLIETYILSHLFSIGLLESRGFTGGDVSGINSGTIYTLNRFGRFMKENIV